MFKASFVAVASLITADCISMNPISVTEDIHTEREYRVSDVQSQKKCGVVFNVCSGLFAIPCAITFFTAENDYLRIFGFAGALVFTLLSLVGDI